MLPLQGDNNSSKAVETIHESAPSIPEQESKNSAHADNDLEQKAEPSPVQPLSNGDAASHGTQTVGSGQQEAYRDRTLQAAPSEDPAAAAKAGAAEIPLLHLLHFLCLPVSMSFVMWFPDKNKTIYKTRLSNALELP